MEWVCGDICDWDGSIKIGVETRNSQKRQRGNVPCLACEMKARCASCCTGCAHFHWVTATSPYKVQIKRWQKKRVQLEKLAKQIGFGSKLLQSAPRLCYGSILMEEPTLRGCKSFDLVQQFWPLTVVQNDSIILLTSNRM